MSSKSISESANEDSEVLRRRKERFLALAVQESASNPSSPSHKKKRPKSDATTSSSTTSNKKAKKAKNKAIGGLQITSSGQHQGDARQLILQQQAAKQAALPPRIIGKSSSLDKQYLRLTSDVNPDHVRPISVLKESLTKVQQAYNKDNDYETACEQLRSIRQDLTVQGIANPFTVTIYEIHARLALENGDISQYQQCSAKLLDLRITNRKNLKKMKIDEFDCYRLLYAYNMSNQLEIAEIMKDIEKYSFYKDKQSATAYALQVIRALKSGNLYKFFRLYQNGNGNDGDGSSGNSDGDGGDDGHGESEEKHGSNVDDEKESNGGEKGKEKGTQAPPYHSLYLLQAMLSKTRNTYLQYIVSSYQTYPLLALPQQLAIRNNDDGNRGQSSTSGDNGNNGGDSGSGSSSSDIKAIVSLLRANRVQIRHRQHTVLAVKISSPPSSPTAGQKSPGKFFPPHPTTTGGENVTATTAEIDCIATRESLKKQRGPKGGEKSSKSSKSSKGDKGVNILSRLGDKGGGKGGKKNKNKSKDSDKGDRVKVQKRKQT